MDRKVLFGNRRSKLPVRNSEASRRSRSSTSRNTLGSSVGVASVTRARSISQTPRLLHPGSAVRSRSRSVEKSRFKKKDIRPVSDKQWQVNQTAMVQRYLTEIGQDDILNNRTSLRPLTLNMFVQIMNTLLEPIVDQPNLTNVNYIERLPILLNQLSYPGVFSASVLKSANTTCSWPHILAMLSWMTIVHEWVTKDYQLPESEYTLEEKIKLLEMQSCKTAYLEFNQQNGTVDIKKLISTELGKLLGLPEELEQYIEENLMECEKTIQKCKEIEKEDETELEGLEKEKYKINSKIGRLQEKIKFKKNYSKVIVDEINAQQQNVPKISETIKRLQEELKQLESEYSVDEDDQNLESQVDALKKQLEMTHETMEYKKNLLKKFDDEYNNRKTILNTQIKDYNLDLFKQSLTYPELEGIRLPQDVSSDDNILQILDTTYQKAKELKERGEKIIEKDQHELKLLNKKIQIEKTKQESRAQELERLKKLNRSLDGEIEQFKQYTEKETEILMKDINEKKQKCVELSKTILDVDNSGKLKEVKERCVEAKEDLTNFEQKMLNFFESLNSYSQKNLEDIDENMKSVMEIVVEIGKKLGDSIEALKKP